MADVDGWATTIAETYFRAYSEAPALHEQVRPIRRVLFEKQHAIETHDVLFDLESCVSSDLIYAMQSSQICGALFEAFHAEYKRHGIFDAKYIWVRAALEPGIVINLFNCRALLVSDRITYILGMPAQAKVRAVFDEILPRLVDARDAIAHDHDRAIGHFRKKVVADVGQMTRSIRNGIADLLDRNGQKFDFDFSYPKLRELCGRLPAALNS
jgi:hypothetical protein